jgi:hypothetical protein
MAPCVLGRNNKFWAPRKKGFILENLCCPKSIQLYLFLPGNMKRSTDQALRSFTIGSLYY